MLCKKISLKDKTLMSGTMDLNVISLGFGDKGKAPSCGEGWKDPANFTKNNDLVKTRESSVGSITISSSSTTTYTSWRRRRSTYKV